MPPWRRPWPPIRRSRRPRPMSPSRRRFRGGSRADVRLLPPKGGPPGRHAPGSVRCPEPFSEAPRRLEGVRAARVVDLVQHLPPHLRQPARDGRRIAGHTARDPRSQLRRRHRAVRPPAARPLQGRRSTQAVRGSGTARQAPAATFRVGITSASRCSKPATSGRATSVGRRLRSRSRTPTARSGISRCAPCALLRLPLPGPSR